jgi:hypothetical protein
MRIIYDNAIDRASSVSADSEETTLPASNMTVEGKTRVFRSANATATKVTVDWDSDQRINAVAIPWCNLAAGNDVRVYLYDAAWNVIYDGAATKTEGIFVPPAGRNVPAGVNGFAFGNYSTYVKWLPQVYANARHMNLYFATTQALEVGRLIAGEYWEPAVKPSVGASVGYTDMTAAERAESGDARMRRGARFRTLRFELAMMAAADRKTLWDIVRGNGIPKPIWIAMLPGAEAKDADEENMLQLWAKLVAPPGIGYAFYDAYNSTIELEEM